MDDSTIISDLIESYWDSIPPSWHRTRAVIRAIAMEKYHLTVEQFQTLRRIRKGQHSVSLLAETTQTSRSAVSRVVDGMVNKGMIARGLDPNDRRNIPLTLTEEGQRVMADIYDQTEDWLASRFSHLTSKESEQLNEALSILSRLFNNP